MNKADLVRRNTEQTAKKAGFKPAFFMTS